MSKKKAKLVKKEEKIEEVAEVFKLSEFTEPKVKLGRFDAEFNRDDLNKLRDKVNELVDHFNAIK